MLGQNGEMYMFGRVNCICKIYEGSSVFCIKYFEQIDDIRCYPNLYGSFI